MSASRVAVVTGGNKGIGFAIVKSLATQFEGDVILAARDPSRGQQSQNDLEKQGIRVIYQQLDISNSKSIQEFKNFLEKKYGGLDVLVNNAAISYKPASTAPLAEQARETVCVNFTGTLNVCRALFPLLRPHARVVNVASSAGHLKILKPNLQQQFASDSLTESELEMLMNQFVSDVEAGVHVEKGWPNPFSAYGTSKVGLAALTKVSARQMSTGDKEDILVNSCCPGWVKTDMAGDRAPLTPEQGAETPVFLAFLPPGSPTGLFFKQKKVVDW
ncbi:carbonyl reductase [NADPH] 1-like [Corticium candelabrum]|uniref:carbonyl reductase [NADPH] 1-like n=1 Tax=Corticium candelabrum TaxID=121492 RepID=UPI002E25F3B3|nr:carbonyl reductase [NADPH] 1-like [Corticium candelabrum]